MTDRKIHVFSSLMGDKWMFVITYGGCTITTFTSKMAELRNKINENMMLMLEIHDELEEWKKRYTYENTFGTIRFPLGQIPFANVEDGRVVYEKDKAHICIEPYSSIPDLIHIYYASPDGSYEVYVSLDKLYEFAGKPDTGSESRSDYIMRRIIVSPFN